MDRMHFDAVTRTLLTLPSRRNVLHGLAGMGFGLGRLWLVENAEARKKRRKRRHRKKTKQLAAAPNVFGCIDVGELCQNAEQCCSGICQGKTGKRTCRAHDTGTCRQDGLGACATDNPAALKCNNGVNCVCLHTTSGSNFCADVGIKGLDLCTDCATDADCEALGFAPGSACVPFSNGLCAGTCASGMACVPPCDSEIELLEE